VTDPPRDWPFDDPPDLVVISLGRIMMGWAEIRFVSRDDGGWQFLDGEDAGLDEAVVVGLATVLAWDASIRELADLPFGWTATRGSPGDAWIRSPTGPRQ